LVSGEHFEKFIAVFLFLFLLVDGWLAVNILNKNYSQRTILVAFFARGRLVSGQYFEQKLSLRTILVAFFARGRLVSDEQLQRKRS
jgi:hypothetical protein